MVALEPIADEDEQLEEMYHQGGDLGTHGRVELMRDMSRFDAAAPACADRQAPPATPAACAPPRSWRPGTTSCGEFVKVMPVDYRRALEQMQARWRPTERQGISVAVGM